MLEDDIDKHFTTKSMHRPSTNQSILKERARQSDENHQSEAEQGTQHQVLGRLTG